MRNEAVANQEDLCPLEDEEGWKEAHCLGQTFGRRQHSVPRASRTKRKIDQVSW